MSDIFLGVYAPLAKKVQLVHDEMYNIHGFKMRATQGLRDFEAQAKIYAQGRTAPGKIVSYSQPGTSWHEYGLAMDSCFTGPDPYFEKYADGEKLWEFYAQIAEAHGLVAGARFKRYNDTLLVPNPDKPHVQFPAKLTIKEAAQLFVDGGLPAVWAEVDKRVTAA